MTSPWDAVAALLASACVAAVATPLVRRWAMRRGVVECALDTRRDGKAVPRIGGVALVLAFVASTALAAATQPELRRHLLSSEVLGLVLAGLAVAVLGLYDDLRGAGAVAKIAVQLVAAGAVCSFGLRLDGLAFPFGLSLSLGLLAVPLTLVWLVAVTNALNIIDGADGLAGGAALFAIGASLALAAARGDAAMVVVMAALAGSVLGFLRFNVSPASILMGDTGSLFLGLLLGASVLRTAREPGGVAILVPIVALGLPLADTLGAVVRRLRARRSILRGDREHVHHRLIANGVGARGAVSRLHALGAALAFAAVALDRADTVAGAILPLVVAAMAGVVVLRAGLRPRHAIAGVSADRSHAPVPLFQHAARSD
jgi:UDP-GlcNAc:undecaprenyl-phosphate GlcNAc-1-phosphate transferase